MIRTTIGVLTVLASSLSQSPDPQLMFKRYLEKTPSLDTDGKAISSVWLRATVGAGELVKLRVDAEYFKNQFKLVIYDDFNMVPLLIIRDGDLIMYDVEHDRFSFAHRANWIISLERTVVANESKLWFKVHYGYNEADPSRNGRILLRFASLFYNEKTWSFTKGTGPKFVVKQVGAQETVIKAAIDFSRFLIFTNFDYMTPEGHSLLAFQDLDVNYDQERLPIHELSKQVRALEATGRVLVHRPDGANAIELLTTTDPLARIILVRLATHTTDKELRQRIMKSLTLTDDDIKKFSQFDKFGTKFMKDLIQTGRGDNQKGGRN